MQQETHKIPASDSQDQSLQDAPSEKGASQNNMPEVWRQNEDHQDRDKAGL